MNNSGEALGKTVPELDISCAQAVQDKTKFSMLSPSILQMMKSPLPDTRNAAILFGIESHVCVLQTALDLLEHQFDVFVVADGVSSSNRLEVPVALQRMRQSGCTVTTSDSLLFEFACDAKHDKFKQISSLVKESLAKPEHNRLLQSLQN